MNQTKELLTVYFTMDESSPNYSEKWEWMSVYQDLGKHEMRVEYKSRWNSMYDRIEITKLA